MEASGRTSLRALLTANAISLTGNKMTLLVIPWFVLETTGSPSRTALAGFFAFLPIPLSSLLGGPLIDRVGFKRMSILADLASAGAVAAIPLLHATIGIEFWQLLVLVFLGALLDAPGGTARASLLADVAEDAETTLERATSLEDAISRACGTLRRSRGGSPDRFDRIRQRPLGRCRFVPRFGGPRPEVRSRPAGYERGCRRAWPVPR